MREREEGREGEGEVGRDGRRLGKGRGIKREITSFTGVKRECVRERGGSRREGRGGEGGEEREGGRREG